MDIFVHRPLTAAFPWVGSAFRPSRRGRSEDPRASRPGRFCAAAGLRVRRGPSTPGASRPSLRMTRGAAPPARAALSCWAARIPTRALLRRCGRMRPVRSFDFGRSAPSAQDDEMPGAPRPSLRMTRGAAPPARAARSCWAARIPTWKCLCWRGRMRPVRSFDSGGCAASAQDDNRRRRSAPSAQDDNHPGQGASTPLQASASSEVLRLRRLRRLRSG